MSATPRHPSGPTTTAPGRRGRRAGTGDAPAWATRAARQDLGEGAPSERFVAVRARHALERLLPRDAAARRWLARRTWRAAWPVAAALGAFVLGMAVDHIGAGQRVD